MRLLLNRFVFDLNFYILTRYRRIKQKSGMPSCSCCVMSSFDWIYVISSENLNWNRKSLRLLLNLLVFGLNCWIRMRYRRIKQKSGMPSFSSCDMTSFEWIYVISSENQNWNRKSLRLLLNLFVFGFNFYIQARYRRIKQKSGISSFCRRAMSSFYWIYVISSENQY